MRTEHYSVRTVATGVVEFTEDGTLQSRPRCYRADVDSAGLMQGMVHILLRRMSNDHKKRRRPFELIVDSH